jgi:hypothetical protein
MVLILKILPVTHKLMQYLLENSLIKGIQPSLAPQFKWPDNTFQYCHQEVKHETSYD